VIDAHLYYLDPDQGDYPWIAGVFQPLRKT
jgi:hypothetical protein